MISDTAGFPPEPASLRQLAARAGTASRDALLFPSLRDPSPRMDEAGTADHAFSSCLGACPGLTSIVIRRASRRFPATGGASYLSASPTFQARQHSRRNCIKSFPSHGAKPPSLQPKMAARERHGVPEFQEIVPDDRSNRD